MRRRTFCASGLTALVYASLPYSRVCAAAGDDVAAMGLGGEQRVLKPTDIDDFRASLRGQLLMPGANGYESARKVWNGAFDRKPALIARCAGAADVTRAVSFARTHELLAAVRSGGHSLSGQSACDGGLMIDLSPMGSIRIDPLARTARVERRLAVRDRLLHGRGSHRPDSHRRAVRARHVDRRDAVMSPEP